MSYVETIRRVSKIRFLIERACQHRLPLSLIFEHIQELAEKKFVSNFVGAHWTKHKGYINIERLTPDEGNRYLSSPMNVMISFGSHFVEGYCRFASEFRDFVGGGSLVRISYPRMIERFQRRVTVRVVPPENYPVVVEFQSASRTHSVKAKSISIRGVGLIFDLDNYIQSGQIFKRFYIHFPDGKTMTRTAQVNEISMIDENRCHVSITFLDRNPVKDEAIRAYMISLSALQKQ